LKANPIKTSSVQFQFSFQIRIDPRHSWDKRPVLCFDLDSVGPIRFNGGNIPNLDSRSLKSNFAEPNRCEENELAVSIMFPPTAIRFNSKLNDLVSSFNSIFGNLLVGIKLMSLIAICLLLYVSIHHQTGAALATALVSIYLVFLIKLGSYLMSMGSVPKESTNFKRSWIYALGYNNARNKNGKLSMRKMCEMGHFYLLLSFSFSGGPFYDIQPSTILTFLSSATMM